MTPPLTSPHLLAAQKWITHASTSCVRHAWMADLNISRLLFHARKKLKAAAATILNATLQIIPTHNYIYIYIFFYYPFWYWCWSFCGHASEAIFCLLLLSFCLALLEGPISEPVNTNARTRIFNRFSRRVPCFARPHIDVDSWARMGGKKCYQETGISTMRPLLRQGVRTG